MKANIEKRVAALEEKKIYRISTLADFSILCAMIQRNDPRRPAAEDIVWDPAFKDFHDRVMRRKVDEEGY
jgi:hypothetical protein